MNRYRHIREQCCEANIRLQQMGLVDLTFGNVSAFDPQLRAFAIKPSGVAYERLTAEEMVVVDVDSGDVLQGRLRPSSDTPTHRCLLLAFAESGVCSIVHTHSRFAVGFAQAGADIPCLGTTHADYFRGSVPVTRRLRKEEISGDYEWNTGVVIREQFRSINPMQVPAALVRGHGPFAWGSDPFKAVETAFALEVIAQMAVHTLGVRPGLYPLNSALRDKHFLRKHGKTAYYGQA